MNQTFNEVTITTTQELNRKAIEFYMKNGLLSVKRSGAGITIKCLPMSKAEEKNLELVKQGHKK